MWQRHCKDFSSHSVRFLKKDDFLNKIFRKIKQHFISNKVYRDFKASKARWISPMTKKALGANELLCDNQQPGGTTCFFNFKEWFIHDRACLIYDTIWYIIKIKWTFESFTYHAIILLLKVRVISTSISIIGPLSLHHSHISHNNSFVSKPFLVLGDVHLALFALGSL